MPEKVSLIARAAGVYDGRPFKAKQRFTATPEDAELLTLLKIADKSEPDPVEEVRTEPLTAKRLARKDETAEPSTTDEPSKRTYRRRDLQPEP